MADPTLSVLLGTAATVGFVHTLIGVDHSLPFVVIGRARGWSLGRTLGVTGLCGLAHVATSVVLGVVGIGLGLALEQLAWIQEIRGGLAAWGLIAFGLVYAAWSFVAAARGGEHHHAHAGADGLLHDHGRSEDGGDLHPHGAGLTVWALFIVFALGPCEALIPLLMAPAWLHHWAWVGAVVAVFSGVTVLTMLTAVAAGYFGLERIRWTGLERHVHGLAGLAIAGSGLAIQALGI